MKKIILTFLWFFSISSFAQYHSQVWNPDIGNGSYKNPVLYADYSDPDVIAVGNDYYLTASSFNCIPGLPILHSKDLINWEIINHAIQELKPEEVFNQPQHGSGVWAPSIRYHNDTFYIYWGDPDYGIFMVKSKNPTGKWDDPICVLHGKGMIDPCPLWDDDGKCYLINAWAGSRVGFNSVLTLRELSSDGTRVIGKPCIVFDGGSINYTTEGPKFYKHKDWYWIFCPAGGVEQGWQLALRSKNIYGPYEWKRVMAQGNTTVNGPHQGAWVHTSEGEDWFFHFNDQNAYGRVVFLQPITWKDNWPIIGKSPKKGYCGEPFMTFRKPKTVLSNQINPQESDEFNTTVLGQQWQWQANYQQKFGMPMNNGCFRIYTWNNDKDYQNLWNVPNLLLQKLPAPVFSATTKIRFAAKEDHQYGGIVMMGMDYQALVINRDGNKFQLQIHQCKNADQRGTENSLNIAVLSPTSKDTIPYSPAIYMDIYLQMNIKNGKCQFAYSMNGKNFKNVGPLFTIRKGKWIGAKMGYACDSSCHTNNRGWIDADWFRVTP